jgi:hypothetical protein
VKNKSYLINVFDTPGIAGWGHCFFLPRFLYFLRKDELILLSRFSIWYKFAFTL